MQYLPDSKLDGGRAIEFIYQALSGRMSIFGSRTQGVALGCPIVILQAEKDPTRSRAWERAEASSAARVGYQVCHKSCPQYERLKLLLHTGKSEIAWFLSAICSPAQLWNDGSTILYAENLPAASVIAT